MEEDVFSRAPSETFPRSTTGTAPWNQIHARGIWSDLNQSWQSRTSETQINHCLQNHKLDFLGIITVTSGCLPPGLWYKFHCASRNAKITWICLDLLAQFLEAIFILFVKRFRTPAWRPFRGLIFSFMASSAFYPITVAVAQIGWSQADTKYGASLYALSILIYVSSVGIYAAHQSYSEIQSRSPEAWKRGRFDIWGQPHQIFHIGMAIGLITHFLAFVKAVDQFYHVKGGKF